METETWRAVMDHAHYEVSDLGRVRSVTRTIDTAVGPQRWQGQIIRPHRSKGYLKVNLRSPSRREWVHNLVLEAFVGPRPAGMQCRHIDGLRDHDALTNLCWGTPMENQADRIDHGTSNRGSRHGMSKLTAEAVRDIRTSGRNRHELAAQYGVHPNTISRLRSRERWAWLD